MVTNVNNDVHSISSSLRHLYSPSVELPIATIAELVNGVSVLMFARLSALSKTKLNNKEIFCLIIGPTQVPKVDKKLSLQEPQHANIEHHQNGLGRGRGTKVKE